MYKVFLVDDEPFILEGLSMILNRINSEISIVGQAENGEEAFLYLQSYPVDILITDIKMPKMNGIELIRRIKSLDQGTRFIVLSGYDDFEYVKQGIHLGIENYLLKPVNVQELRSTLENTIEKMKKDEQNQYKSRYIKKDFEILRENILYRWMKNTINGEELRERAALLHIDLECKGYQVAILRFWFDQETTKQVIQRVYHTCDNYLSQYPYLLWFQDIQGQIVVIFFQKEEKRVFSQIQYQEIFTPLLQEIKKYVTMDPLVTIGKQVFSYASVWESYQGALESQKYRWIFFDQTIIDQKETELKLNREYKKHKTGYIVDFNHFSNLLIGGDIKEVEAFIKEVFSQIKARCRTMVMNIQSIITELLLTIEYTTYCLQLQHVLPLPSYEQVLSYFLEARNLDELEKLVKEMALKLVEQVSKPPRIQSPVVRQVIQFTLENYKEDLSLKMLGNMFNVNSVYLGQLFKKDTGKNYIQYLHCLRMQKAKYLLLNSTLKIHQIALSIGYSDVNYFYRMFKKYVGISPSEVRENQYRIK